MIKLWKRLPILDIVSGVEHATENIATYMKNSFRAEWLNILKRGRSKYQIHSMKKYVERIKDNKLIVVEDDKGRVTCIIKEDKVNKMIETELNNQNRYHSLKKDNIDIMLDLNSIRNQKNIKEVD